MRKIYGLDALIAFLDRTGLNASHGGELIISSREVLETDDPALIRHRADKLRMAAEENRIPQLAQALFLAAKSLETDALEIETMRAAIRQRNGQMLLESWGFA